MVRSLKYRWLCHLDAQIGIKLLKIVIHSVLFIRSLSSPQFYILLPGSSFDVGSGISMIMHRSRYDAQGQKLVISSIFFKDEKSCQFSFLAVLDTWHMDMLRTDIRLRLF